MEEIMSLASDVFDAAPAWVNAVLAVVGAASAITALTPSPHDDNVLGKVRRVLEWVALNIGHAKPRR